RSDGPPRSRAETWAMERLRLAEPVGASAVRLHPLVRAFVIEHMPNDHRERAAERVRHTTSRPSGCSINTGVAGLGTCSTLSGTLPIGRRRPVTIERGS